MRDRRHMHPISHHAPRVGAMTAMHVPGYLHGDPPSRHQHAKAQDMACAHRMTLRDDGAFDALPIHGHAMGAAPAMDAHGLSLNNVLLELV